MKAKKTKFIWIAVIVYGVLLAGLMLSLTLSAYRHRMTGYTDFSPAAFNVAIRLPEEGSSQQYVSQLSMQEVRPGMYYSLEDNSAAGITFYVTNGTVDNLARVAIDYTVRLRTAQNLPLEYILTDDTGASYWAQTDGEQVQSTGGQCCYEYVFYTESQEEVEPQAMQEAVFHLDAMDNLQYMMHQLFVQWPFGDAVADPDYMKEVEILEIVVSATSSRDTTQEDEPITIPGDYAQGMLMLWPGAESNTGGSTYAISVDLRNFQVMDEQGLYSFTVDNAVGMYTPEWTRIRYDLALMVPADLHLEYNLICSDIEGENLLSSAVAYRLYDEKTGDYWEVTVSGNTYTVHINGTTQVFSSLEALMDKDSYPQPDYRLYALYSLQDSAELTCYEQTLDGYVLEHDQHDYTLKITGDDLTYLESLALKNRLELILEADFLDQLP